MRDSLSGRQGKWRKPSLVLLISSNLTGQLPDNNGIIETGDDHGIEAYDGGSFENQTASKL